MTITFQPIEVMIDGGHRDGRLVLINGRLISVLVHVMPDETQSGRGDAPEGWYQEAGFGPCSEIATTPPPMFETLDEVRGWIDSRLNGGGAVR